MFFVELDDGTIITGMTATWQDIAKDVADGKTSIKQAGLTDMKHIRESVSDADAYYYFTEGEAVLSNRMIDGEMRSVPLPPKVIGEEIAAFYSAESAEKIFRINIEQHDSSITELEKRLDQLRATDITSDEVQNQVNAEITTKQGIVDRLRIRRKQLLEERKRVMEAGGFIVVKRIGVSTAKMPLDISPEDYATVNSHILEQNREYWIGMKLPGEKIRAIAVNT